MNGAEHAAGENEFGALLAAYDEALAKGQPPESPTLPPELAERVAQAQACLRRLEQHRRDALESRRTPPLEVTPPESLSLQEKGGLRQVGRWQFLRELGRGGSGIVYLAWDPLLCREVAVKVPRPEVLLTPELRRRFLREAQAAAGFEHPNLVPVYEAGEVGPFCYIVSAYCRGTTIGSWLKQHEGFVAPRVAARLLAAVTDAVAYIHGRGVLHRDIKPNNILITAPEAAAPDSRAAEDGARTTDASILVPKLTDFGLAKQTQELGEETKSGTLLGTPLYMAPEQAEGRVRDIGTHTDVYALGVLLYELLTGRPPFLGDADWAVRKQIATADPMPPRRLRLEVPRDLETICLKCLQKDPRKRYASAAALAEDLRRFLEGRPILARQVGSGERFWRWCRRNPVVATLTGAVALLILAGTGTSVHFAIQAVHRAEDFRKQLYVSNVNRAHSEWQSNKVGLAERLLESCPEDLRGWEWHYARHLLYQERVTIPAYFAPGVSWYGNVAHQTIAFSPDSQWVAAMDWDHTLKLWDIATGTKCRTMQGDTGAVFSIAFSRDGKWVASGNSDHTVRIWNTETGNLVRILRGHTSLVYHVQFSSDGRNLISAGSILVDHKEWLSEMEIIFWQADTGQLLSRRIVADANPEWGGVAFSPNGQHFAAEGERTSPVSGPSILGLMGSLLGQGPFLAAVILVQGGGENVTLRIGDTATGHGFHTKAMHYGPISDCAFAPDGNVVATAGRGDRTIRLWERATGKKIQTLRGHTGSVRSVAFSPDGTRLASGGEDHTVRLWNTATGNEVAILRGHTSYVQSVAFSSDGRWIASAGEDGTVRLWDALQSAETVTLYGHTGYPSGVILSPDGQRLLSFSGYSQVGTPDGIKAWDTNTGQQLMTFPGSEGWLTGIAVRPDGLQVASCDKDRITLWDATSGRPVDSWAIPEGGARSVVMSPDGQTLAYACGNRVSVVDARTHREIRTLGGTEGALYSVSFSPDGKRIAALAQDRVLVWDLASGDRLFSFFADNYSHSFHYYNGPRLAFSSDGRLAASDQNRITIRDAITGQLLFNLSGHSSPVTCLAFSPDGTRLATGSLRENDVKLWETRTGQELFTLRGHTGGILSVAFSRDGMRLASCSVDRSIKLWNAEPVSSERVDRRRALEIIQLHFDPRSGMTEMQDGVWNIPTLPERVRTIALQMAQQRLESFGRIPLYYCAISYELWLRGWTEGARRMFTFAEQVFRKSVLLTPAKASAHGDFAWFLVTCPDPQFRDADRALIHAQKAVALDPASADFASLLGMAQYRAGEWQAAVETLEKALERGPGRYAAYAKIFLAMAHQQLGHATEALRRHQDALTEIKEKCSPEELDHLRSEATNLLSIPQDSAVKTEPANASLK